MTVIIQLSYVCGCIIYVSGSCHVTLLTVKNIVEDVMHGRGLCKKSSIFSLHIVFAV
jgi:hypothetical protein